MKVRDRRGSRNSTAVSRVKTLSDGQLAPYMDNAVMGLGQALDGWRFHSAPRIEVERAIDAIVALWDEIESRNLT
jgi:hypothetical protein